MINVNQNADAQKYVSAFCQKESEFMLTLRF